MRLEQFKNAKIPIVEIFKSISGEGISQGGIVSFIRTAGCNLRCNYCDTTYSYDEESMENEYITPDDIVERLQKLGCKNIIYTGGEPLEVGKAKRYLPIYLAMKGFNIRIETNGSCPVYSRDEISIFMDGSSSLQPHVYNERFGLEIFYALDVKCPGSQMSKHNIFEENFNKMIYGDEIKFVVSGDEDINYAFDIINKYNKVFSEAQVVLNFSPVFQKIEPEKIATVLVNNNDYFTANNINVRLSLQIHKFIWSSDTRGV